MATTLARLFDFVPATPIVSADVDGEFNQLVNILNGTTTNKKVVVKVSDAGDPPCELDQLGAGPIQKWFQTGVLRASITNLGQFKSEIATGTAPLVIASTTEVANLNAARVGGFLAGSFARKDDSGPQVFDGNVVVSSNVPEFVLIDENNTKHIRFALENTTLFLINETLTANIWTVDTATNVTTFNQIPVLPAANPTTANQATRKQYVDDKTTAFSASLFYAAIPAAVETTESVPRFICPEGTSITITKLKIVRAGGSHTGATVATWTIKRRNAAGAAQADVGTISLDDTNNTVDVLYENNIADVPLTAGDQIYALLTTRTGTPAETLVTVAFIGTQKLT